MTGEASHLAADRTSRGAEELQHPGCGFTARVKPLSLCALHGLVPKYDYLRCKGRLREVCRTSMRGSHQTWRSFFASSEMSWGDGLWVVESCRKACHAMLVLTEEAIRDYERDHSFWKLLLCSVVGDVRVLLRH